MRGTIMVRITSVTPLEGFTVRLRFSDDSEKEVDLEPFLHGEVFEEIKRNPSLFRSIKVDSELGTVTWANGADIDPDVLYHNRTPAWMTLEKKTAY